MKHFSISLILAACIGNTAANAADMPVSRIILSTSGLAQFEHRAKVTGDAALEFPARLEQVDDILKSLVIFDAKGRLGGVTLPGRQPLNQIFKDLPFNRGQLGSSMLLLNAYQGAELTIKGPGIEASGKILQVTAENMTLDDKVIVTRHRLSLMTASGLKQAVMEDLHSIQFADAKVKNDIARALDSIRENSTAGQRLLTVNLLGTAEREVTLSYVVEAPLWKTAYRMVVPAGGKAEGFLQGWAIVENMTSGDWKNVDLSLVSGNPVTFRQALYQSYYVARPEIPVQVFGLALPRVDEGSIATADKMQMEQRSLLKTKEARRAGAENFAAAPSAMMDMAEERASLESASTSISDMAVVSNAAQGAEAETQVMFRFPNRLSLKSGQSMMLPFVSRTVPMERISLYQPETSARHPLAAVEIKNDGETGLPPGVLTLYEESALLKGTGFAGDAQLPALAQGEKRLVSYALDSKTTIDREDKSLSTEDRMTAERGVIRVSVRHRAETTYTLKAPAKESRTVVIEHPRMGGDYKLVSPDPKDVEVTATHYRIKTALKPGEVKTLQVALENQIWESYGIDSLPTEQITAYASGRGNLAPDVRKAFEELGALRRAVDALDRKIAAVDQERAVIFQDQERVRENLKSLGVKSDVQQKYLDKLNAQEDRVAALDKKKQELSEQRQNALTALADKISGLTF